MAADLSTVLAAPFTEAVQRTRAALAAHGFGVITEIDLQATFEQKLSESTSPYVILGACQPRSALRAIQADTEIGLLLPCNVVVYLATDGVHVSAVDPRTLFASAAGDADLTELAEAVRGDLAAAIADLSA